MRKQIGVVIPAATGHNQNGELVLADGQMILLRKRSSSVGSMR